MTLNRCDAQNAFAAMIAIAHADGRIVADEREMIDTFARALGIRRRQSKRYWRAVQRSGGVPESEGERLALLSMLARVGWADGKLLRTERAFLEDMAEELGIERLRMAEILGTVEWESRHRRDQHRRWWIAASALVAISITVVLVAMTRADEMEVFKDLEHRHRGALALVHTEFRMVKAGHPVRVLTSTGTGFFVSSDGLLATNKHVVRPWLFDGRPRELLAAGYEVREDDVRIWVWREGSAIRGADAELSYADAFSTLDHTLTVAAQGPDSLDIERVKGTSGVEVEIPCHRRNNNDLVLLRCVGVRDAAFLELAADETDIKVLDPVMVIGYPRGVDMQESRARSIPTVGRIRSVGETLHITAPIVNGNSGGPLLDTKGRVVGIATRTRGDSTLGCCIRCEHIARMRR